jgi:type VI protein secretion system component VasK
MNGGMFSWEWWTTAVVAGVGGSVLAAYAVRWLDLLMIALSAIAIVAFGVEVVVGTVRPGRSIGFLAVFGVLFPLLLTVGLMLFMRAWAVDTEAAEATKESATRRQPN